MSKVGHSQEHWDRVFSVEFEKESDRAAVILTAAMLEQTLEVLLKASLVPCSSHEDPLFDSAYAPLSAFSAKIEISYRIGLISRLEARILHLVRKIRNEFAHNVTGCSFENASIHSRVVELVRGAGVVAASPHLREGFAHGIKGDFQMTMSWTLWDLWGRAEKASQKIEALPDWRPTQAELEQQSGEAANAADGAGG